VTNGRQRLGLYEARYMGDDSLTLHFRGGDVETVASEMVELGLTLESGPAQAANGGWSARVRDPDGYLIFLDKAPWEAETEG
jgi:catechol 2,3-dioxygenase-like lactoylglutathione lyase family enzyme